MVLIPEEEYARWKMTATNPGMGKQELTQLKPSERELNICAQSSPGERHLTQTEPSKKKIIQPKPRKVKSTQTELATSEKPIQNDWGAENLCTIKFRLKKLNTNRTD